jgi:hypothetical protein
MLRCELAFFLAASKRAFEKKASKVTGQDDKKKLLRTKKKKKGVSHGNWLGINYQKCLFMPEFFLMLNRLFDIFLMCI